MTVYATDKPDSVVAEWSVIGNVIPNGNAYDMAYATFVTVRGGEIVSAGDSEDCEDYGERRVAVVTGGSGAIGAAIAARLAADHTVVNLDRDGGAGVTAHQALARPLTPEDTAAVVAMLARDDAAALTGQTLVADGGLVLM